SGRPSGGRAPVGYRNSEGELQIVEPEARIVRRVFEEYLAGRSQLAITQALDRDGVPTKAGGLWHQGTLRAILANPTYKGSAVHKGGASPGTHEPIIDPETWDKVAALRDAQRRSRGGPGRRPVGKHLFRKGSLKCGRCGSSLVPRTDPNRKDEPY